jgi:hypothetical protein
VYDSPSLLERLSKAEELHVVGSPNGDGVTNARSVDALDVRAVDSASVSALRVVVLGALGLTVVVAENASLFVISMKYLQKFRSKPTHCFMVSW